MNVSHPTSTSVTRKRNVSKHLGHISVLAWMVILGMELTVKVKIAALYQTQGTDSVHHISRQLEESWKYSIMRSCVFLMKSTVSRNGLLAVLGIVMKLCFECLIDPLDQK